MASGNSRLNFQHTGNIVLTLDNDDSNRVASGIKATSKGTCSVDRNGNRRNFHIAVEIPRGRSGKKTSFGVVHVAVRKVTKSIAVKTTPFKFFKKRTRNGKRVTTPVSYESMFENFKLKGGEYCQTEQDKEADTDETEKTSFGLGRTRETQENIVLRGAAYLLSEFYPEYTGGEVALMKSLEINSFRVPPLEVQRIQLPVTEWDDEEETSQPTTTSESSDTTPPFEFDVLEMDEYSRDYVPDSTLTPHNLHIQCVHTGFFAVDMDACETARILGFDNPQDMLFVLICDGVSLLKPVSVLESKHCIGKVLKALVCLSSSWPELPNQHLEFYLSGYVDVRMDNKLTQKDHNLLLTLRSQTYRLNYECLQQTRNVFKCLHRCDAWEPITPLILTDHNSEGEVCSSPQSGASGDSGDGDDDENARERKKSRRTNTESQLGKRSHSKSRSNKTNLDKSGKHHGSRKHEQQLPDSELEDRAESNYPKVQSPKTSGKPTSDDVHESDVAVALSNEGSQTDSPSEGLTTSSTTAGHELSQQIERMKLEEENTFEHADSNDTVTDPQTGQQETEDTLGDTVQPLDPPRESFIAGYDSHDSDGDDSSAQSGHPASLVKRKGSAAVESPMFVSESHSQELVDAQSSVLDETSLDMSTTRSSDDETSQSGNESQQPRRKSMVDRLVDRLGNRFSKLLSSSRGSGEESENFTQTVTKERDSLEELKKEGSVYVVGENDEEVAKIKQLLPESPFHVPVALTLPEAAFVILLVEQVEFDSNEDIKQALATCKSKDKQLMVLYVSQGGRNVQTLLVKLPREYKFMLDEEWTPWYPEREREIYRDAALSSILRTQKLLDEKYHQHFHFFLSHMQKGSQAVVSTLYYELNYKCGFRVWWDMKAPNLTIAGMKLGVESSDHFVLVLQKDTLSARYIQMELETAIEHHKNIVVLYDTRRNCKEELVNDICGKYYGFQKQLLTSKWIAVDLRGTFSDAMIVELLQACGYEAPNQSLHQEFENITNILRPSSDDSSCSLLETKAMELSKYYCEGTREWIFESLDEWSNKLVGNKVFAIVGHAGIGKSVFASRVIQRSQMQSDPQTRVVGYHFFVHDDPDFASQRNCIISLCKQLRDNVKGFRNACDSELGNDDISELSISELFNRVLLGPARQLKLQHRVVVVLDALDECEDGTKFLQKIVSTWKKKMPDWLGLLVTCRPSVIDFPDSPEKGNQVGITVLQTDDERNKQDVEKVVRKSLEETSFGNTAEIDEAVRVVTEKSEGLFLYIRFFQEMFNEMTSQGNQVTVDDIKQFPSGIEGYYQDYFQRLFNVLGEDLFQDTVGAILASRGPLPKELWMRCFGIHKHFDSTTRCKGSFNVYRDALKVFKSLMHIPTKIGTARSPGVCFFIHKSMSDFLVGGDEDEKSALKLGLSHLHVSAEENGSRKLLNQVRKVAKPTTQSVAKDYAIRNMLYHLCLVDNFEEASSLIFNLDSLMLWLTKSDAVEVSSDIVNHLVRNGNVEDETLQSDSNVAARIIQFGRDALRMNYTSLREEGNQLPSELPSQILARVSERDVSARQRLQELRSQANSYDPGVAWLKPLSSSLESAMPTHLLDVLRGHSHWVESVAFNHDGTRVVSGSRDSTVRIWDATTGDAIGEPLRGHESSVRSVAFNHDGTRIVSGSSDKTVRIWDATTGKAIGEPLRSHEGFVRSVAFNHDGTRIVSGSVDRTVRIWDATTGESVGEPLRGHEWLVISVAYNHDGTRIVSGSSDKTVRVWDATTGEAIGEPLRGHSDVVNSVAYNHDGTRIVSGSHDKTVRIWDAATGEAVGEPLRGHQERVTSIAFNYDGTRIVSGSNDNTVRIWDATTGEAIGASLRGHESSVNTVAFNHDGTQIVSGSWDETVRIWGATTGETIGEPLRSHEGFVRSVAFNHDATRIVSGSVDKTVRIWDATTGEAVGEPLRGHEERVTSIAFNHDGTRVVSGSRDSTVRIWDVTTGEAIGEPLRGHEWLVTSVAFNHDGTRIVSGSVDRTVRIWDATTGEAIGEPLRGHEERVTSAAFNHDGTRVVSGSNDATVRIWDATTGEAIGEPLQDHKERVTSVAFNHDGTRILSGSVDKTVRTWDTATGTVIDELREHDFRNFASIPLQATHRHVAVPFMKELIGFTSSNVLDNCSCMVYDKREQVWKCAVVDGCQVHVLLLVQQETDESTGVLRSEKE